MAQLYNNFNIKISDTTQGKIEYLRKHKVKYQDSIRFVIDAELERICKQFDYKDKEKIPF
jgi:hypothetical protein